MEGATRPSREYLRRASAIAGSLLVVVAFPLLALQHLPAPYVSILLLWAVLLVRLAWRHRKRTFGAVCFNLAVALLVLVATEAFFWMQSGRTTGFRNDRDPPHFIEPHEILGRAPVAAQKITVTAYRDGETLYRQVYTVDENRLRVGPQVAEPASQGSVLFFGGSFTFGDGLADSETVPYRTGEMLRGKYRAYNFGFGGYGPHHMLAALEHGMVATIVAEQPRFVIYQGLPDHVRRAAGRRTWSRVDPQYVPELGGGVRYAGRFGDVSKLEARVYARLEKSFILTRLFEYSPWKREWVERFGAIVDTSRERFEGDYPGSEFHVILWSDTTPRGEEIVTELLERGLRVHRVSEILPGYGDDDAPWVLPDGHPNTRAAETLARYVIENVVGNSDADGTFRSLDEPAPDRPRDDTR